MPSLRVVFTGGPHSGKSTLCEVFARLGHRVVPEAAIGVIEELVLELGLEGARAWRKSHARDFQERIAARQLELEAELRLHEPGPIFFDRGLWDGAAYCRLAGVPLPETLVREQGRRRYDEVILCELILPFRMRTESGRTSNLEQALRIEAELERVWRDEGYQPRRLAAIAPAGDRARALLGILGLSAT